MNHLENERLHTAVVICLPLLEGFSATKVAFETVCDFLFKYTQLVTKIQDPFKKLGKAHKTGSQTF